MNHHQEHVDHHSVSSSPYCMFLLKTLARQSEFRNSFSKNWNALIELSDLNEIECKNEYEWIDITITPIEKYTDDIGISNYTKFITFTNFSSKFNINKSTDKSSICSESLIIKDNAVENVISKEEENSEREIEDSSNKDTKRNDVNINVIDDVRKIQEIFVCPCNILIKKMPYFERFFTFGRSVEDVQISVHCDLEVFKRLMYFIGEGNNEFSLDPKYAIHILVSAHFLQMEGLVDICLQYCHENMNAILETSCPVGSLNDNLVERITSLFTFADVEALADSKDKIKSRMFKVLCNNLIKQDYSKNDDSLMKCSICEKIFLCKLQSTIPCKPARLIVGQRGQLLFFHAKDQTWDKMKYVENLYEEYKSWRQVFWKIWGMINVLHCCVCEKPFACCDFELCRYHTQSCCYSEDDDKNVGNFQCCGQKSWKFNLFDPNSCLTGCSTKNHTVSEEESETSVFKNMITYKNLICISSSSVMSNTNELIENISKISLQNASMMPNSVESSNLELQKNMKSHMKNQGSVDATFGDFKKRSIKVGQQNKFSVLASSISHSDFQSENQIWNSTNSLWHNQDSVREYDSRQLDVLTAHLQRLHGMEKGKH